MSQKVSEAQSILEVFNQKYINAEQIGKGSFAKVFKCQQSEEEFVAIKVIDFRNIEYEHIPYMKNEIVVLQQSQNNNIIQLIEAIQTKQRLYLVLEYCFIDLERMMKTYYKKGLPEDLVIIILRQLVNGLHYLHKNKIIHRDIKLENIGVKLSSEDEYNLSEENFQNIFRKASYKLLDFGFAKQMQNDDLIKTYAGTEQNMAPEILQMQPYSISADMYSLGVCVFQMITGELPYDVNRMTIDKMKSGIAKFHLIKNETLRLLVQNMLKYDPSERLTWTELYKYQFFQCKRGQVQSILDLQLQNNREIYNKDEFDLIQNEKQILQDQEKDETINQNTLFQFSEQDDQFQSTYRCKNKMNQQQRTKIQYWNQLRNICILLSNLSTKLILLLNSIDSFADVLQYYSLYSEFNSYINYLCDLNQQTYNFLIQEMSNLESQYNTFQDYINLKNNLDSDEDLKNIQINKQTQSTLFSNLICFTRQYFKKLQKLDLRSFQFASQEFYKQFEANNILIFQQNLQIMYDSNYKMNENNLQQLKLIQCQIYRILIDLARVRAMFCRDWKGGDEKIDELRLIDFENEPDLLSKFLTDFLDLYKLQYDL